MGLQSSIWSNKLKTTGLIILFPVFLRGVLRLVFSGVFRYQNHDLQSAVQQSVDLMGPVFMILGPVIIIRGIISFFFYRQIIFSFAGAKPITRKEVPELYNIVENLCISRGLPTPKIGIMEDDSMNAFAVGWKPENARIVFSRGIVDRLNKSEIEAVAGHELTHIINKDSLLMIVIIVFIGIIATLGEILLRVALYSRGGNDKKGNITGIILLLGVCLMVLGYIFFPLIQLALSRRREYLADAGSVDLTKDKNAMISALQKISKDPVIESIQKQTVAAMCIETPFEKNSKKGSLSHWFSNMLSTHPSIEDRVKALEGY